MNIKTADNVTHQLMTAVREIADEWRSFWFKPADPFTLGMIRVLTGLMLTYNLLVWGLDLEAFFGVNGLQPLVAVNALYSGTNVLSFWTYVPAEWLTTVHYSCLAIAILFSFGLFTRATSLLAFAITVSYSQRVPIANFGLDQILGLLCLYLAIGPSGAALSVDNWLRNRRLRQNGLKPSIHRSSAAQMTLRLIQIHICVIYFWAGFAKLKGDSWWTGEAMWQVIANMEYQTTDLTWMARVPWLPYLFAHATVAWEVFFCVLVWNRKLRPMMLAIGTAMHVGIGAFLGMWTFGLVMTFPYLAFARPSRWRRLAIWRTSQPDGDVEGFAEPHGDLEPPTSQNDDDEEDPAESELKEALQDVHDDDAEPVIAATGQSVHPEVSDDDILGDEPESPPAIIDYRDTSGVASANIETQPITKVIDDDYVVEASVPDERRQDEHASEPIVVQPPSNETQTDLRESVDEYSPEGLTADESDLDLSNSGAVMSDKSEKLTPKSETKNELSTSRMERLKPKSANTLTGAPAPKVDGRVEDSVLAPETEVMLIALHAPERNTFRTYLRRHDIPCRAAISAENAVQTVLSMKPAAVLLSGSCMNPEEIITLVDDLNDMVDAPVLALLTLSQINLLSNDPLSAHVLQYPASLRQIRESLTNILLEEGNAKPRCSLRAALTGE